VVERALAQWCVRVEEAALVARGHRHPDRRGQTLSERTGGDLNALGVPELGVTRRLALEGAQRLDVGQLEAEATQIQLDVEGEAGVTAGQHEPVAPQPVHVAGVVAHLTLEQRVGQRGEAHRRSRVTVADFLHRIGRKDADRIDGLRIDVGPVVRMVRAS
jgi:hypothetical protein